MMDLGIILLLVILLSLGLAWRILPRKRPSKEIDAISPGGADIAVPLARHYEYFALIRRALSPADTRYIQENAPPDVAKRALRERRAVAKNFLVGLREDFSNLARLGRTVAALSPAVSRQQETERLALYLKFHLLYALVWLRLSTGNLPLDQLEQMTSLVEKLALRTQEVMSEIIALSARPLSGSSNA